jgi:hypothetical protein
LAAALEELIRAQGLGVHGADREDQLVAGAGLASTPAYSVAREMKVAPRHASFMVSRRQRACRVVALRQGVITVTEPLVIGFQE